jgi:hypothetical protein
MPIHAPYSAAQWKGIDATGIPSFYLLRNGKVVDQCTGWSENGKADLLTLIGAAKKVDFHATRTSRRSGRAPWWLAG